VDPLTLVMNALDPSEAVSLASELVKIPSHVGANDMESAAGAFLESYLAAAGIPVIRQEALPGRDNLIARVPGRGGRPSLMLNGHHDTVPPGERMPHGPFGGGVVDGRLYGRGAADMKGGLAAMAVAVAAVARSGARLRGELVFSAVVAEESGNVGAFHLAQSDLCADHIVVGEPSTFQVVIAHKGVDRCRVTVLGRAAHGSTPEAGVNAIGQAARLVRAVDTELIPALQSVRHPLLGSPTINVGTIHGGRSRNMVPDQCVVQIGMRLVPGQAPDALWTSLEALAARLAAEDPRFQARVEREPEIAAIPHTPLGTPPDAPLVVALSRAVLAETGRSPQLLGLPYFTDAGVIARPGRVAVVCGPGDMAEAHTDGESIAVEEIEMAARTYARLAVEFCA